MNKFILLFGVVVALALILHGCGALQQYRQTQEENSLYKTLPRG
jgi:hypothetical protein